MRLKYPYYNKSSRARVNLVLKSGRVNYWTGKECKLFEKEFSDYWSQKLGGSNFELTETESTELGVDFIEG